jgi:anti-anti-sigma regulatory factor
MYSRSNFPTLAKHSTDKSYQNDSLQGMLFNNVTHGITSIFNRPLWFLHNKYNEKKITSPINSSEVNKKEDQVMKTIQKKPDGILPFSIEQTFTNKSFEILGSAKAKFGNNNGKSLITVQITGKIIDEAETDFCNFIHRVLRIRAEKWQLYLKDLKMMSSKAFWVFIRFARTVKKRGVRIEIIGINPFILDLMRGQRVCRHFHFKHRRRFLLKHLKFAEHKQFKKRAGMMKSILALFLVVIVGVGLNTIHLIPHKAHLKQAAFSFKIFGFMTPLQQTLKQEQAVATTEFELESKAPRNPGENKKKINKRNTSDTQTSQTSILGVLELLVGENERQKENSVISDLLAVDLTGFWGDDLLSGNLQVGKISKKDSVRTNSLPFTDLPHSPGIDDIISKLKTKVQAENITLGEKGKVSIKAVNDVTQQK